MTELGYLLTKLSFWLSLWHDISISWHGGKESLVCFANNAIHPWPQVMPIFDRKMPPGFTPDIFLRHNFVYISNWIIGETNASTKTFKILFSIVMPTFGKSCRRPWKTARHQKPKLSWIVKQIFQDGSHRTCTRTLGRKHTRKSASFWKRKHVQYFLIKFAKYLMLEACWLWFVIFKRYVELTRLTIESHDPIFFTGTWARSRVSGTDRLFPHGSEFGPNLEILASPVIPAP